MGDWPGAQVHCPVEVTGRLELEEEAKSMGKDKCEKSFPGTCQCPGAGRGTGGGQGSVSQGAGRLVCWLRLSHQQGAHEGPPAKSQWGVGSSPQSNENP